VLRLESVPEPSSEFLFFSAAGLLSALYQWRKRCSRWQASHDCSLPFVNSPACGNVAPHG